jgi:hypothetical protein
MDMLQALPSLVVRHERLLDELERRWPEKADRSRRGEPRPWLLALVALLLGLLLGLLIGRAFP